MWDTREQWSRLSQYQWDQRKFVSFTLGSLLLESGATFRAWNFCKFLWASCLRDYLLQNLIGITYFTTEWIIISFPQRRCKSWLIATSRLRPMALLTSLAQSTRTSRRLRRNTASIWAMQVSVVVDKYWLYFQQCFAQLFHPKRENVFFPRLSNGQLEFIPFVTDYKSSYDLCICKEHPTWGRNLRIMIHKSCHLWFRILSHYSTFASNTSYEI